MRILSVQFWVFFWTFCPHFFQTFPYSRKPQFHHHDHHHQEVFVRVRQAPSDWWNYFVPARAHHPPLYSSPSPSSGLWWGVGQDFWHSLVSWCIFDMETSILGDTTLPPVPLMPLLNLLNVYTTHVTYYRQLRDAGLTRDGTNIRLRRNAIGSPCLHLKPC